jgi:DNA modification methylase
MADWTLHHGDCRPWLASLADASVDAVVSDPPYAEIDRAYGRLSEADWHALMRQVVTECRRILRPHGSAVFILQPNSERVGRMRPWLWDFLSWASREWGVVQDVYWWNFTAPPNVHAHRTIGLLRPSVKTCVWLGPPDCYRDQSAVLWSESQSNVALRSSQRSRKLSPSGYNANRPRAAAVASERNGGVTPFNLLPIDNANPYTSGGGAGHGAATPLELCLWWVRYLSRPGDLVVDPFAGSGTVGVAALAEGRRFAGAEQHAPYHALACRRLTEAGRQLSLLGEAG